MALSIRQPWAWAILHAGKDVENRNFLGSVIAETPDALLDALPEVIAWAARIEAADAMISVARKMPRGVLEIRWTGQEAEFRIRPSCDVREVPEGWEIQLPKNGDDDEC